MKKLIAAVFSLSLTGSAMAAGTVGFDFGSVWFHPAYNDYNGEHWSGQGQSFALNWAVDSDMTVGVYTEDTQLNDGFGGTEVFTVQALQVSKGIVKNVAIGLNLGTFYESDNGETGPLTDVVGTVTILSGSGDKVSGNLKATVAGRWADDTYFGGAVWNGYTVGLSAGISF